MSNQPSYGCTLADLPKSHVFTDQLPADSKFPTPESSFKAKRADLGPRMVRNALYTFVRPEAKEEPELLVVGRRALQDVGLLEGEELTEEFKEMVAGNKIFWNPETEEGVYPWAQCYGGWQFGSWAGQLGDGRAISLFESTNPTTKERYEIQLKGAGMTPFSRFADGKAVLRSSIREFVVSEALHALRIPTTRALSLTLTPKTQVRRESIESGAIVCRFASSWLRIGTFDLLRARGDRALIRQLATYLAEHVFSGWNSLQASYEQQDTAAEHATTGPMANRFAHLYQHIAVVNAITTAHWQAYGFTNGVLNTDNTSLVGLSLDFGPFAFLDNFDLNFTPNHDDHDLRYAYHNQPAIIWWNLERLGESLGELMGAGSRVDETTFISASVSEDWKDELVDRAHKLIKRTGNTYLHTFLTTYHALMTARLGLKAPTPTTSPPPITSLLTPLLEILQTLSLDYNHFFRHLSNLPLSALATESSRLTAAAIFFHSEGGATSTLSDTDARALLAPWLAQWHDRALADWGDDHASDVARQQAMRAVNPRFVPRAWVLDEVIQKVSRGERAVLQRILRMVESPFEETWAGIGEEKDEEERWCGDVPREERGLMCSCSS